jgi:hypothetical protein
MAKQEKKELKDKRVIFKPINDGMNTPGAGSHRAAYSSWK